MRKVLGGLPPRFNVPVVIVQHRHRDSDQLLVSLLQEHTTLRGQEVEDQTEIEGGSVYVAPPDYHVLVDKGTLALSTDEPVRYSRPSIDVTFESAADAYAAATIGVVLTGANDDGSRGLRRIADRGGRAIVQDPATADSAVMPTAALRAVPNADVVKLDELGAFLDRLRVQGALAERDAKRPATGSALRDSDGSRKADHGLAS
jgi:two-component system, chemotaxis family, protein-glutamate methylesterase/glutaminase